MAVFFIITCITIAGCDKQSKNIESTQTKETVTCDTGEAKCSVTCKSGCCLAIYWPDTKECSTSCDCAKPQQSSAKIAIDLKKDTRVSITAKNVKLSQIALALDNIKGHRIFISADKQDTVISVAIKNITLQKAVESFGLRILPAD